MAESGGEDEGQNLLAVVVDINPNQVTSAMTNGNYAEHRKHFNSKEETELFHSCSCCSRGSPTL